MKESSLQDYNLYLYYYYPCGDDGDVLNIYGSCLLDSYYHYPCLLTDLCGCYQKIVEDSLR